MKRAEAFESDYRRLDPRFQGDNFDKNMVMVDRIKAIAMVRGATPGQIALAWLLHQDDDIVPIPGTKRVAYVEENTASGEILLDAEELDKLASIVPAGSRYAKERMEWLDMS